MREKPSVKRSAAKIDPPRSGVSRRELDMALVERIFGPRPELPENQERAEPSVRTEWPNPADKPMRNEHPKRIESPRAASVQQEESPLQAGNQENSAASAIEGHSAAATHESNSTGTRELDPWFGFEAKEIGGTAGSPLAHGRPAARLKEPEIAAASEAIPDPEDRYLPPRRVAHSPGNRKFRYYTGLYWGFVLLVVILILWGIRLHS